jgi:hypothetical protein
MGKWKCVPVEENDPVEGWTLSLPLREHLVFECKEGTDRIEVYEDNLSFGIWLDEALVLRDWINAVLKRAEWPEP